MRIKRTKSKCKDCALRDRNKVYGDGRDCKVVIVGEAPGQEEDRDGFPFVGKAGKFFIRACSMAGLKWETIYKTNRILCRPPSNNISSYEAEDALIQCKGGFVEEIEELRAKGAKVFIAAGRTAMEAFGITGSITKNRGSVYLCQVIPGTGEIKQTNHKTSKTIVVIPTFHPSFIMRGQWKEEVTWVNDIEKAYSISKIDYEPPKENFNINPTIEELRAFVEDAVKHNTTLGVDIETSGLDPERSKLVVVGLAKDGETAISVPFLKQGFERYWGKDEELEASSLLNEALSKCPTIFQNALFDVSHLRAHGYQVGNVQDDVLLMHHAIHPELPHNLGYIVSVYGRTPYWKDVVLKSEEIIKNQDDQEFRTYNLRDSVVLHQVLEPMLENLREVETEWVYRNISLKLIEPILEMQSNGILIDQKRLKKFNRDLKKDIERIYEEINSMEGLSPELNFDSGDDMRYLFYGIKPKKYFTAVKEMQMYEVKGSKRRTDTKKYQKIESTIRAIEDTVPLYRTKATVSKSEAGNAQVNEQTRLGIMIAANNRLAAIKELADPAAKDDEVTEINRLLKFLRLFNEYKDKSKLLSTYGDFKLGGDGRVHFNYMIHGTSTGRLSSRGG